MRVSACAYLCVPVSVCALGYVCMCISVCAYDCGACVSVCVCVACVHTCVSVHVCARVFCFSPCQPPPQGGSPECEPSDRTNQVLNGLPCTCVVFLQEASPWHLREEPLSGRLVRGWLVWVSECGACLGAPGRCPCRQRGGPELPGGDQCGDVHCSSWLHVGPGFPCLEQNDLSGPY